MNIYSYPPIISAILFLSLGIFIVFKAEKKYFISIPFALICIATILWQGTWAVLFNVENRKLALFLVKFGYSGIIFIPFAFYHFIVNWVEIKKEKIVVFTFYIVGAVFLYFLWSSDYFISGFYEYFWGYYPKAGILHPLYLLFLSISASRIFIILAVSLRKKNLKPIERNQIKYVLAAIAIYTFAASDFLINYGIGFYPPGVIFILASLFLLTYAIIYYQFMDINIFYRKVLTDILLFTVIGLSFFFITLILENIIFNLVDSRFIILNFFVIFFVDLFAYLFHKFKSRTEKIIEKALFKDKYDYLESITQLGQKVITYLDLEQLLNEIVKTLTKELKLSDMAIYLYREQAKEYWLAKDFNDNVKKENRFTDFNPYVSFLAGRESIIVWEEEKIRIETSASQMGIVENPLKKFIIKMHENRISVTMPLVFDERLIGIVQLSDKNDSEMYSQEDLKLLTNLGKRITLALMNAQNYGAIGKLYEMRSRQERIMSISELAAGFSHQLTNPLCSIKTFFNLFEGGNNTREDLLKFLKATPERDLKRIENIISEVKRFSEAGIKTAFLKLDINEIIKRVFSKESEYVPDPEKETSLDRFKKLSNGINPVRSVIGELDSRDILAGRPVNSSTSNGVNVKINLDDNLPSIFGDDKELETIFAEMGINAIESMDKKSEKNLEIKTSQIDIKSKVENKWQKYVQVEIKDNGCGISEKDLGKIFNPLHTTKYENIGLNLAIAHRIIEAHGGFIDLKTKEGEGTSIFVDLPLDYKPSQERIEEEIKAKKAGEDVYRGGDICELNIDSEKEQEDIKKLLEEHRKIHGV